MPLFRLELLARELTLLLDPRKLLALEAPEAEKLCVLLLGPAAPLPGRLLELSWGRGGASMVGAG